MVIIYIMLFILSLYIAYQFGKHKRDKEIREVLANTWKFTFDIEYIALGGLFDILKGLAVFPEDQIQDYLCSLPSDKPIIPSWIIDYIVQFSGIIHGKKD